MLAGWYVATEVALLAGSTVLPSHVDASHRRQCEYFLYYKNTRNRLCWYKHRPEKTLAIVQPNQTATKEKKAKKRLPCNRVSHSSIAERWNIDTTNWVGLLLPMLLDGATRMWWFGWVRLGSANQVRCVGDHHMYVMRWLVAVFATTQTRHSTR